MICVWSVTACESVTFKKSHGRGFKIPTHVLLSRLLVWHRRATPSFLTTTICTWPLRTRKATPSPVLIPRPRHFCFCCPASQILMFAQNDAPKNSTHTPASSNSAAPSPPVSAPDPNASLQSILTASKQDPLAGQLPPWNAALGPVEQSVALAVPVQVSLPL